MAKEPGGVEENKKQAQLAQHKEDSDGEFLTTNQGLRINDNQNSLLAGERGPTLMEDLIFREKMTHFDHERIPERVVHARGSGAHGYFQVYEPMSKYTRAHFLNDPNHKTPVFVRFSTVVGSRGSTDLARDTRGFATKFYTEEGVYDLVANNMPVFFIQDAMKFPDLVHSIKPEQDSEIPQATGAHDTFWDFVSHMPESMHMIMWLMSDRGIPRSFRMMEGFGVHTFRFVNAEGKGTFVKFHWKPLQGTYAVTWDEAQKISGVDPDYLRRDLWEAIENGDYPEYELGVQLVDEADEHKFPFDLLDSTKIIPDSLVPVKRIGKMTLNRNPDNFFAETEQVAFHPGHVVPGIDFTNDPLLQGRLFSYVDTQLKRLGGPNFHEIPINRSVAPVHNNQRDGHMRQTINKGKTSYDPNGLRGGCPFQAKMEQGGFVHYATKVDGHKIRSRSPSFMDHFSQATLFYNSQTEPEKMHLADALKFEIGKVKNIGIRQRMVGLLTQVDEGLAADVAKGLGLTVMPPEEPINRSYPADADPKDYQPRKVDQGIEKDPALSMTYLKGQGIKGRQIAILAADGVDENLLDQMIDFLKSEGARPVIIAPTSGFINGTNSKEYKVEFTFLTTKSVLYDAVYVPGGAASVSTLMELPDVLHFLDEQFRHCKAIAIDGEAAEIFSLTYAARKLMNKKNESGEMPMDAGLILGQNKDGADKQKFRDAVAQHRVWERELQRKVPA